MKQRPATTTRLDLDACPFCRHRLDAATAGLPDPTATPSPGDVTICLHCTGVLIFDANLKLRAPTPAEQAEIQADPDMLMMLAAAKVFRETRDD